MNSESSIQSIETTIGELVEIVTGIALESGSSEEEAYYVAAVTISDLLAYGFRPDTL